MLIKRMRGLVFCTFWYLSIVAGFYFLYCPCLLLLVVSPRLFRISTDRIFALWETYSTALLEILCGVRIAVLGPLIRSHEKALLVMNHRTRLDWLFLWGLLQHWSFPAIHRCKFVLKSSVKMMPALGWVMQMTRFLYIKRKWASDQVSLHTMLNHLRYINNVHILLFPEGTDLSLKNKSESQRYASLNNLPSYEYVLHPRTTGLSFLVQQMRQNQMLDAVYDITVAYPDIIPESESYCLQGIFPKEVSFFVQRYEASNLPTTPEAIKQWCKDLWNQKEKVLRDFYRRKLFRENQTIVEGSTSPTEIQISSASSKPILQPVFDYFYISFISWSLFVMLFLYMAYYFDTVKFWILGHTVLFSFLSLISSFSQLEMTFQNYLSGD